MANPAHAFALSGSNLISFHPASPTVANTTAITGVNASETLVGIDFRPQNGLLYGLGVNAASDTATLYVISQRTGVPPRSAPSDRSPSSMPAALRSIFRIPRPSAGASTSTRPLIAFVSRQAAWSSASIRIPARPSMATP